MKTNSELLEGLVGKTVEAVVATSGSFPHPDDFTIVFTDNTYLDVSADSNETGPSYPVVTVYNVNEEAHK